jgi:hypothetical protein
LTTLLLAPSACASHGEQAVTTDEAVQGSSLLDIAVYDGPFYLATYPDLQAAFGGDLNAAANHWLTYGVHEGRTGAPSISSIYYLSQYPDLQAAFGSDFAAALNHYLTYGINEGRASSPVFDVRFYLGIYPDLQAAFGPTNYRAALNHWYSYGINEGRQASAEFNPRAYLAGYPDVAAAYGATNYMGAIEHYLEYGRNEGRSGNPPPAVRCTRHVHVHIANFSQFDGPPTNGCWDYTKAGGMSWCQQTSMGGTIKRMAGPAWFYNETAFDHSPTDRAQVDTCAATLGGGGIEYMEWQGRAPHWNTSGSPYIVRSFAELYGPDTVYERWDTWKQAPIGRPLLNVGTPSQSDGTVHAAICDVLHTIADGTWLGVYSAQPLAAGTARWNAIVGALNDCTTN